MTLLVPRLDDRTFDQLAAEGRALIPRYTGIWTDFNPSDPGITLLELFAYLTETAIFQLDQVPAASVENFLRLVDVCRRDDETVPVAVGRALDALHTPQRAVTAEDFELLARNAAQEDGGPDARVRYVLGSDPHCRCGAGEGVPAPLALIVVVPRQDGARPGPDRELTEKIFDALREARIVATRLHVVGPRYTAGEVTVEIVRKPGGGLTVASVREAVVRFLDPLTGWFNGEGWPFGRNVFPSELYQMLEGLDGVDHVARLELRQRADQGTVVPVAQIDVGAATGLPDVPAGNVTVTVTDVESGSAGA